MQSGCFGFLALDMQAARKAAEEKSRVRDNAKKQFQVADEIRGISNGMSQELSFTDDIKLSSAMTSVGTEVFHSIARTGTARCRHANTFLRWWYDIELVDGLLLFSRLGRLEDTIHLENATVISKDVEVMVSYGERLAWTLKFTAADEALVWSCALQSAIITWKRKALEIQHCGFDIEAAKALQQQKETMALELIEFKERVAVAEQEKERLRQDITERDALRHEVEELSREKSQAQMEVNTLKTKCADLEHIIAQLPAQHTNAVRTSTMQVTELKKEKEHAQVGMISSKTNLGDLEKFFAQQQTPRFGSKQQSPRCGSNQIASVQPVDTKHVRTTAPVAHTKIARKSAPVWNPRAKALQKTKSAPLPFPALGNYVM